MNRPVEFKTRPQLALESYLVALLQDATAEELPEPLLVLEPVVEPPAALDEFQLAVLEEQARDAQVVVPITPVVVAPVPPVVVAPVVEVHLPPSNTPPPVTTDGRPSWAAEPFECLLFDVAGLTLAVPLVCLGSIYSLEGQELTPLFGQPEWFLGILPSQAGNLKVLDTARWVMPTSAPLHASYHIRYGAIERQPPSARHFLRTIAKPVVESIWGTFDTVMPTDVIKLTLAA